MECPLDLAKSVILHREKLEERSPLALPNDWPSTQLKSLLPYYIEMLEKNAAKRSLQIWLMIAPEIRTVIGSIRLKQVADDASTIDLGYETVYSYRRQGYCFEAVQAVVRYVFLDKRIKKITAECDERNIGSIKILEKLGMRCVNKEVSFLMWELKKESIS